MRLIHVDFRAYKRLVQTGFYTDRKLVALLGPNESGKTSILRGLTLFNDDLAIPAKQAHRAQPLASSEPWIVTRWLLEPDDVAAIESVPIKSIPRFAAIEKLGSGGRRFVFDVALAYLDEIEVDARAALRSAEKALAAAVSADGESHDVEEEVLLRLREVIELSAEDVALGEATWTALRDDLRAASRSLEIEAKVGWKAIDRLIANSVREPDIPKRLGALLVNRVPKFEFFEDADRELRASDEIDSIVSTGPNQALTNLLALAGYTFDQIRPNTAAPSNAATNFDRANDKLDEAFQAWQQHPVSVLLRFNEDRFEVFVRDKQPDGMTVALDERSDGLRLFVALAAFLARREQEVKPILLIDEAEARLHWDAQADLISMLATTDLVRQIIYSTHSPGCLPPDLGTGVRFVEPEDGAAERSTIRHDFWRPDPEGKLKGNPLLVLMGASAAAFSKLRAALIAEGPSDMILLPAMIRAATGKEELDYQIVPGIAVASKEQYSSLAETAVRVLYTVDGDPGGLAWLEELNKVGVAKSRIRPIGKGIGLEDLLDRDLYLDAFEDLLFGTVTLRRDELAEAPLKHNLDQWLAKEKIKQVPSAIAVAEHILGRLESDEKYELKFATGASRRLKALDEWASKEFARPLLKS